MTTRETAWCKGEVQRWVTAGFLRGLSSAVGASSAWVSPTFVVYGRKARLVVDLRRIIVLISPRLCQYQRLQSFLVPLTPGDHLVSWDISDDFYHIILRLEHYNIFRFVVDGVFYEPVVLQFGISVSPWAWTKVIRPLVAAMRRIGFTTNAYVDYFADAGRGLRPAPREAASNGRAEILTLCQSLGLNVHPTKGVAEGTQRLPLLGLLVDTWRRLLSKLRGKTELGRAIWPPEVGLGTTDASIWGLGRHWNNLVPAAGFFFLGDQSHAHQHQGGGRRARGLTCSAISASSA